MTSRASYLYNAVSIIFSGSRVRQLCAVSASHLEMWQDCWEYTQVCKALITESVFGCLHHKVCPCPAFVSSEAPFTWIPTSTCMIFLKSLDYCTYSTNTIRFIKNKRDWNKNKWECNMTKAFFCYYLNRPHSRCENKCCPPSSCVREKKKCRKNITRILQLYPYTTVKLQLLECAISSSVWPLLTFVCLAPVSWLIWAFCITFVV